MLLKRLGNIFRNTPIADDILALDKSFRRDSAFEVEEFISTALGVWQKAHKLEKQADGSIILELNGAVFYELVRKKFFKVIWRH